MAKFGLPDITFAEKDSQVIENELITTYEETAEVTLADGDPRKKMLQAEVPILSGQRSKIDYAGKQNLLAYAAGDFLDHLGILVGTPRISDAAAVTTERFTLSAIRAQATTIVKGKRVTAGDNVFFETTAEAVIPAGQLFTDIEVQCTEAGDKGNGYAPGEINVLVDPIPYVASVSNLTESEGGADKERDDAYRERIQQAPERFSTAGPDGAYEYFARSASTLIIDVAVYSPSPGVVAIRPLLQGGELPGQAILDKVYAACNEKKVRPLTDQVQVSAPEQVTYAVDATYWIDSDNASVAASIRTKVDSAVNEYLLWQKSALGRAIDPSELIYKMKAAGAKRVAVTAPLYQALEKYQVAHDETVVNVTYGGLEDG